MSESGQTSTPQNTEVNTNSENKSPQSNVPQAPEQPQYVEIKVDKRKVRLTPQERDDYAAWGHAASDRMREAAQIRAEVDNLIETAKNNPIEALMNPKFGLTKEQIRQHMEEWYAREFIDPETLTEDQKKNRLLEEKVKKYEQEQQKLEAQRQEEEENKIVAKEREYLENNIIDALQASGLPKNKFYASRIAFYMRHNIANGWDAPIPRIIQQVKTETAAIAKGLASSASPEQLIDIFGEDNVNKILQHQIQKIRSSRGTDKESSDESPNYSSRKTKKTDYRDVNRYLRNIRLGKS